MFLTILLVFSAALADVNGVRKDIDDAFERLAGPARATGKVNNQFPFANSRQPPGQRGAGRFLDAFSPDQLREARHFLFDHRARRLGGNIARAKSGAAAGDDDIAIVNICPDNQLRAHGGEIVGQYLAGSYVPVARLEHGAQRRTGGVWPFAARARIARDQDFDARRRFLKLALYLR